MELPNSAMSLLGADTWMAGADHLLLYVSSRGLMGSTLLCLFIFLVGFCFRHVFLINGGPDFGSVCDSENARVEGFWFGLG
jgi:hypothetical protein